MKEVDCPLSEVIERDCSMRTAECYNYQWKTGKKFIFSCSL